jgi:hypothetical protein
MNFRTTFTIALIATCIGASGCAGRDETVAANANLESNVNVKLVVDAEFANIEGLFDDASTCRWIAGETLTQVDYWAETELNAAQRAGKAEWSEGYTYSATAHTCTVHYVYYNDVKPSAFSRVANSVVDLLTPKMQRKFAYQLDGILQTTYPLTSFSKFTVTAGSQTVGSQTK